MSFEKASLDLQQKGFGGRIRVLEQSSATVELAAQALGVAAERIAKTIALKTREGRAVLVVAAGDARIDGGKFKRAFGFKPGMLAFDEVEPLVGHRPGGVTPFGRNPGVDCWVDISVERFETVFPAVGDAASAVELTPAELEAACGALGRVDVCKTKEISVGQTADGSCAKH